MRDYVIVWLYPPELWAPAMDGDIETIDGLGDKAYLSRATAGGFDKVKILVAGDFMLEARAGSPDQARGLAELSLKRLTESGG